MWRIRRAVGWLLRPLMRRLIQNVPVDDPWEPLTSLFVTPQIFGPGSLRLFPWYFEGDSSVQVSTVDDVCSWLGACEYLSDRELFNEADFWQHPRTFEHLRKGDCEDHALWAWCKLTRLGYHAQFFIGDWLRNGRGRHAWVVFERDNEFFLLEPVIKDDAPMVRPLSEARTEYEPHFSVDVTFKMQSYAGYLLYVKDRERRRRDGAVSQGR